MSHLPRNEILIGNALELAQQLPDKSIHCAVTSIPYWGLRSYDNDPVWWPEVSYSPMPGLPPTTIPAGYADLGLEPDPWSFIAHIVAVFREVHRILRDDSCCWINVGDSYATSSNGRSAAETKAVGNDDRTFRDKPFSTVGNGLKQKDLCGIPWRVAFALQADGWYLRSDIPWIKRSAMPGSQKDRPTTAKEYIFLLSKKPRYYFDMEAVKRPSSESGKTVTLGEKSFSKGQANGLGIAPSGNGKADSYVVPSTRNIRESDWFFDSLRQILDDNGEYLLMSESGDPLALTVNPRAYSGAHFACFPEQLVEPMILSSTSEYGCCGECGAPYERIIDKQSNYEKREQAYAPNNSPTKVDSTGWKPPTIKHNGWQPTCRCDTSEVEPAIVLDPFIGSGTTARVAVKHRRHYIGFELNPTYATDLASERLNGVQIQFGGAL